LTNFLTANSKQQTKYKILTTDSIPLFQINPKNTIKKLNIEIKCKIQLLNSQSPKITKKIINVGFIPFLSIRKYINIFGYYSADVKKSEKLHKIANNYVDYTDNLNGFNYY